jgi:hypothetical protein
MRDAGFEPATCRRGDRSVKAEKHDVAGLVISTFYFLILVREARLAQW